MHPAMLPLMLIILLGSTVASPPGHGWDTASQGQFIDFGYSCPAADIGRCVGKTPFTEERAKAVAQLYSVISIEKCAGVHQDTEEAIWESAKLLKSFNPALKVYFYLSADMGHLDCYSVYEFWKKQASWHLRNDTGHKITNGDHIAVIDYTNDDATEWWASIPLNDTMYAGVIDGVLADSADAPQYPGISEARLAALAAGKGAMMEKLQAKFNATNGGVVLQNVLSFYNGAPFGLDRVHFSTGAMAEPVDLHGIYYGYHLHFAVFESVYPDSGKLNVTRVTEFLDAVSEAARQGKMVVMGTWPGQYVDVMKWFNDTQPRDVEGWKAALLRKHAFALCGWLTVATPLVYMQYEMWYEGFSGGAVPCPADPSSCPAPDPWYPDLFKPLGAPLGPAVRTGNVFVRHFQHATSTLNLDDPDSSTVVFKSPDA